MSRYVHRRSIGAGTVGSVLVWLQIEGINLRQVKFVEGGNKWRYAFEFDKALVMAHHRRVTCTYSLFPGLHPGPGDGGKAKGILGECETMFGSEDRRRFIRPARNGRVC